MNIKWIALNLETPFIKNTCIQGLCTFIPCFANKLKISVKMISKVAKLSIYAKLQAHTNHCYLYLVNQLHFSTFFVSEKCTHTTHVTRLLPREIYLVTTFVLVLVISTLLNVHLLRNKENCSSVIYVGYAIFEKLRKH